MTPDIDLFLAAWAADMPENGEPPSIDQEQFDSAFMQAWYALRGENARDGALPEVALSRFLAAQYLHLPIENRCAALLWLSQLLRPEGLGDYRLVLQRTRKGRPKRKSDAANLGHKAAHMVEKMVGEGVKQEAALAAAGTETGLSRAEIMKWMGQRSFFRESAAKARQLGPWAKGESPALENDIGE